MWGMVITRATASDRHEMGHRERKSAFSGVFQPCLVSTMPFRVIKPPTAESPMYANNMPAPVNGNMHPHTSNHRHGQVQVIGGRHLHQNGDEEYEYQQEYIRNVDNIQHVPASSSVQQVTQMYMEDVKYHNGRNGTTRTNGVHRGSPSVPFVKTDLEGPGVSGSSSRTLGRDLNLSRFNPPPDELDHMSEHVDAAGDLGSNMDVDGAGAGGAGGDGDADDGMTYCICKGVSYGQMIACDDPNCETEWVSP